LYPVYVMISGATDTKDGLRRTRYLLELAA